MTKQTGLGDNLYVAGYNVSGDINSLGKISGGPAMLDVTDITQSAHSRLGGLRTGEIDFTSYFDPATGFEHDALSGLPRTDVHVLYCRGTTQGNPGAAMVAKQIGYDGKRAKDGSFTFDVTAQSNGYGLEWGTLLTAGIRTDTTGTNGTAWDQTTASTSFGWQAYAQVFSVAGTSVTLTIQDSANNSTWANLSGAAFTAVNAGSRGFQRLAGGSTDTVRRYLRVVSSGTFSSASFAVLFVRNTVATTF